MTKIRRLFIDIAPYYRLEIDSNGVRVRSFSKHAKGRELTLQHNKDGYVKIKMKCLDGVFRNVLLHQLVAKLIIGQCPEGWTVNHKDTNKDNNFPHNLEYLTRPDNIHHAIANGAHVACHPEQHGHYKDGRALKTRISQYKHEWYLKNRERLLVVNKRRYQMYKKGRELIENSSSNSGL